ncbi:MAG: hypothetical protein NVSMB51_05680 [Solirubrobacteraceae bacterium]
MSQESVELVSKEHDAAATADPESLDQPAAIIYDPAEGNRIA